MTQTISDSHYDGGDGITGEGNGSLEAFIRQIIADLNALNVRSAAQQAKLDSLVANFNNHRGSAGVHAAPDTTNVIGSPVATDVTADILTLLNDEATQYDIHIVNLAGGIHGATGVADILTEAYPATDLTTAVALGSNLRTKYTTHIANTAGGIHGGADATNTIAAPDPTDWDTLITFCNEFKNTTGFNAHIILTGGGVHGGTGVADAVTAADCGVQKTALELEINEFKTDLNAHIANLGSHPGAGTANSTTAATTETTSVALVNGLKATANTHFADADDHFDADTEVVAGTASEYEDILAVVAEWKAAYVAHAAKSAVHSKADAANAETVLGTGGAVTVGMIAG